MHSSGVNLRSEGTLRREGANQTEQGHNGGVGVRCSIGGYVDGPLGTTPIGTEGAKAFDTGCIDPVSP